MKTYDASVIIPAFNEQENIVRTLSQLEKIKDFNLEVLVIVDHQEDLTISAIESDAVLQLDVRVRIQNYGFGPANAVRYGIDNAKSQCVLVMMADGSDDAEVIPDLINLVNRGVSIACASRYMSGGQQIGGPRFKKFLSKLAGRILYVFANVGTHDPTNSFKGYSKNFIDLVGIESRAGFEIGIELVSKARRHRMPVAEVPTIWLDRTSGNSNFHITKWIPHYLKWFFHCFGPAKQVLQKETVK